MDVRAKITVTGQVQRAGYRDLVDETAYGLRLKGQVRNLDGGSVEIVCEGDRASIEELIRRIRVEEYPVRVEGIRAEYFPARGDFREFSIIREQDIALAAYERMDAAARYLRQMHRDLSGKQDGTLEAVRAVDSSVRNLDSDVRTMDSNIRTMDQNIGAHFDRLDRKYDAFGESLSRAASDIHDMRGDVREIKADVREAAARRKGSPS